MTTPSHFAAGMLTDWLEHRRDDRPSRADRRAARMSRAAGRAQAAASAKVEQVPPAATTVAGARRSRIMHVRERAALAGRTSLTDGLDP